MSESSRQRGEREDETVRTILYRARRRAQTVSQRCVRATRSGLRTPTPGSEERVDPEKLQKIRPAPRNVDREDAYELGLAAAVKLR